jgi:predicted AAA+ superfamily ATPase
VDTSIATAALRILPTGLLNDFDAFGLFFESIAIRDLRIYADVIDGKVYHYRDSSGLEIDAIVELPFVFSSFYCYFKDNLYFCNEQINQIEW